jgi:hypothetical protein
MVVPKSTHNAEYWARVTRGLDFSDADRVDPVLYNRILWKGMKGNKPYPASLAKAPTQEDREEAAERSRGSAKHKSAKPTKPDKD